MNVNRNMPKISTWLLHEAFCLFSQADKFKPYEKHHSTVKDACELAQKLEAENLFCIIQRIKIFPDERSSTQKKADSIIKEISGFLMIWKPTNYKKDKPPGYRMKNLGSGGLPFLQQSF